MPENTSEDKEKKWAVNKSAIINKYLIKSVYSIVMIIILGLVALLVWSSISSTNHDSLMSSVHKSEFQAVFLSNGQAYFGHITNITNAYFDLNDVWYLQAQQSVQPQNSKTSDLSLIKLGNEIHGPEDEMFIARPQVLFWENLKPTGKVTQAIDQSGQ